MAEGWLRHLAGDRHEVASAGTQPVGLNPGAVEVMHELGIDIAAHRSKHLNEFLGVRFDHVITVCDRAKEACPIFPGASSMLHWNFDDPAAAGSDAERRSVFTRVRDEIGKQVRQFIEEMS
jgi:arsenate reductase (thioredoxin)